MKCAMFWRPYAASCVSLLLFGLISSYDAVSRFGWQAVDLPPIKFFLFSFWTAVRNVLGYSLVFAALPYLLGKRAKWVLIPLFVYAVVIEVAIVYTSATYHAALGDIWLLLLTNSSVSELLEFARMSLTIKAVAGMFVIGLFLFIGCRSLNRAVYPRVTLRTLLVGAVLVLPFFVFNCLLMNWHFGLVQMRYSDFPISTVKAANDMAGVRRACDYPELPESLRLSVDVAKAPNIVIVLGESATRNHWHLYGYARTTTPRMDEICRKEGGGVALRDVVGTQPETVSALSLLLTDVLADCLSQGHWTLAEAYRRAGYQCTLISNQHAWGDANSQLFRIFNGCENRISLSKEFPDIPHYDEKMVPYLREVLAKDGDRPNLVFVHLAGMHYPVRNANPPEEDYYSDNVDGACLQSFSEEMRDRINRYDNGIRYEDKVIGLIVDSLKDSVRPSCMFFTSDHGESPHSAQWRNYEDEDVYEIPVVAWFSESYRKEFPQVVSAMREAASKKMQLDELTHGLLDIGFVVDVPGQTKEKSFLDPSFTPRMPRMINKWRMVYSKDMKGRQ